MAAAWREGEEEEMFAMVVEVSVTESALLMRMRGDAIETLSSPEGASVSEVRVREPAEMLKRGREMDVSVKQMEVNVASG